MERASGQRISPLVKRPTGRCTQTVAVLVELDDGARAAVQVAGAAVVVVLPVADVQHRERFA